MSTTVVIKWDRKRAVYEYYLCNDAAKPISKTRGIDVKILAQYLPRTHAAELLGYDRVEDLP